MTECDVCNGTGYICDNCGDPEDECDCEAPDSMTCDECGGSGEVEDDD